MNPYCPKCDSNSTRRTAREKSIRSRLMHFFGLYPWECLTCQHRFFSKVRYVSKRNAAGEVYTGSKKKRNAPPGSEEKQSS